ncbi:hypothetical protein CFR75_04155 [Komagataeibacter xylinus]|uniref:Uncharacterized protein n=1 Tax=Komagataeibacter xylinus TaxID=28448 RepID=A0A318PKU7_KOMXY|nr:hypothetical protein [Komagataeibacter xylinus]AZV39876.1 hypothetical protein CXP35_15015 [Komagataeibacter xylinus]PYD57930.1 hypothetical protein CFR75_04155 [Komagataeibacter xylinus]GBQ73789.1 hypothetical protein AA15237_1685 [Komagataeibacter xylinus NBRC 15237]
MNTIRGLCAMLGLLAMLRPAWGATVTAGPSAAEKRIIDRQISRIADPATRRAVQGQDMAWQMTTFLCQNAARTVLVRMGSQPHRFFLQDVGPGSQVVASAALVSGRGQFLRVGNGLEWAGFSWACHLDPATGHATHFDVSLTGPAQVGP